MAHKYIKNKAFSLLELVIAIALLGVVVLGVCGVFIYGLETIKKGKTISVAVNIANKKVDEINNIDLSDSNGILYKNLCASIEGYDPTTISPVNSYISWDISGKKEIKGSERLDRVDYNYDIKIEGYKTNLKKVSITVKWMDAEAKIEKKVELATFLSRKGF